MKEASATQDHAAGSSLPAALTYLCAQACDEHTFPDDSHSGQQPQAGQHSPAGQQAALASWPGVTAQHAPSGQHDSSGQQATLPERSLATTEVELMLLWDAAIAQADPATASPSRSAP